MLANRATVAIRGAHLGNDGPAGLRVEVVNMRPKFIPFKVKESSLRRG